MTSCVLMTLYVRMTSTSQRYVVSTGTYAYLGDTRQVILLEVYRGVPYVLEYVYFSLEGICAMGHTRARKYLRAWEIR